MRYGETAPDEECECGRGGKYKVSSEKDIIEEMVELAEKKSIPVEMVSSDTSEGAQFMGGFGGIGAFLRYK